MAENKKVDTDNTDEEKMPPPPTAQQKADILKLEEEKLKSKFPNLPGRPARGGHSSFLQKRLAKGQKFFDSGDYQMAKQSHRLVPGGPVASPALALPTGQAHPTPSSVPARKTSIIPPHPHYDHSGDHQHTHPEGPHHLQQAQNEGTNKLSA